jgi:hypothetical protein
MDPVSGILLLAAQFGTRRIISSLAGDDVGGLFAAIVGLLGEVERSQSTLISIEKKLDGLVDQRYEAGVGAGTRQLERSVLPGRSESARATDLERADEYLVDASHSAQSGVQRAVVERLLVITSLMRNDSAMAADSCRRLHSHVGDALAEAYALHDWPFDEARRRMSAGEFGTLTQLERIQTALTSPDPRWNRAYTVVQAEAQDSLNDIGEILEFAIGVGDALDVASGLDWSSLSGSPESLGLMARVRGGVVVKVPEGVNPSVAGVTVRLGRDMSRELSLSFAERRMRATDGAPNEVFVSVSRTRRRSVECWLTVASELRHVEISKIPSTPSRTVQPGDSCVIPLEMPRQHDLRPLIAFNGLGMFLAPSEARA